MLWNTKQTNELPRDLMKGISFLSFSSEVLWHVAALIIHGDGKLDYVGHSYNVSLLGGLAVLYLTNIHL